MTDMSNYLKNQIRNHLLRTASWTKPTVLAVALFTTATTDAGGGTEVTNANGYARVNVPPLDANWTGAADGHGDNVAIITFPTATGSAWPGPITHVAVFDSATYGAGNMLMHAALATSKTVGVGDTFTFPIGTLDWNFN